MSSRKINFFFESIKTIKKSGTVTQSGPALCKVMTKDLSSNHKTILELGAGDGAITRHILKNMCADATLLSFEINPNHYSHLSRIDDARFFPILDCVENIESHIYNHGFKTVDIIISSLPFMVLKTETTLSILEKVKTFLKEDGLFVQYHYTKKLGKLYKSLFNHVNTELVLFNAPPAIVYKCKNIKDFS